MSRRWTLALLWWAAGCGGADADGDGYPMGIDCHDNDPKIHPDAVERCNGLNDDCDPTTPEGGTITVDDEVTFDNLEEALAYAEEGSTVVLCGTIYPPTRIDTSITLRGQRGAALTRFQGNGDGPVLTLRGEDIIVEGITVSGGRNDEAIGEGGGIDADVSGDLSLFDVVITDNRGHTGGGLRARVGDDLRLADVLISNNRATKGGGLWTNAPKVQLAKADVVANRATRGAGLFVDHADVRSTRSSRIRSNIAELEGGGVWFAGGSWVGGQLSYNAAEEGGGMWLANGSALDDLFMERNDASYRGGGLFVDQGQGELTSSQIEVNDAGWKGGGVYLHEDVTDFLIDRSSFYLNDALSHGGGLALHGTQVRLHDTLFSENLAQRGAAIYSLGDVLGDDTTLRDNTASLSGGGLHLGEGAHAEGLQIQGNTCNQDGGGVFFEGEGSLHDTALVNNDAFKGGGLYVSRGNNQATELLLDSNFADRGGAAYLAEGVFALGDSEVLDNAAEKGGGFFLKLTATLEAEDIQWGTGEDANFPNALESTFDTLPTPTGETFTCSGVRMECQPEPGTESQ